MLNNIVYAHPKLARGQFLEIDVPTGGKSAPSASRDPLSVVLSWQSQNQGPLPLPTPIKISRCLHVIDSSPKAGRTGVRDTSHFSGCRRARWSVGLDRRWGSGWVAGPRGKSAVRWGSAGPGWKTRRIYSADSIAEGYYHWNSACITHNAVACIYAHLHLTWDLEDQNCDLI